METEIIVWNLFNNIRELPIENSFEIILSIVFYKFLSDTREAHNDAYKIPIEYTFESIIDSQDKANTLAEAMMSFNDSVISSGKYDRLLMDILDEDVILKTRHGIIESIIQIIDSQKTIDVNFIDTTLEAIQRLHGKAGGEFTPHNVSTLLAGLIRPRSNDIKISDFCCGCGSLVETVGRKFSSISYFCQDIDSNVIKYCKIRLMIAGVPFENIDVVCGDTLFNFPDCKFDIQVSSPPFRMKIDRHIIKDRAFNYLPVDGECSNADILYLEEMILHMKDENSEAAMICCGGMLYRGGREKNVRKYIIENNLLDAVFKLPGGIMPITSIPIYILILRAGRRSSDVYICDTSLFFGTRANRPFIEETKIDELTSLYNKRQEKKNECYKISIKEITENDFVFLPEKYLIQKAIVKALKGEKTVKINSVVDIIQPHKKGDRCVKCLKSGKKTYPLSELQLKDGNETDVILQKGDIYLTKCILDSAYLIDDTLTNKIYGQPGDLVLRCSAIPPEYLLQFIKSDLGREMIGTLGATSLLARVSKDSISRAEIPIPKNTSEEYRKRFEIENRLNIDYSSFISLLSNKDRYIESDSFEDVLGKETVAHMRVFKPEVMKGFLDSDIKELNSCFNVGAYKATLILAGSILEAVLIDWLSEIDGVDYFDEQNTYMVIDRNGNQKKADLIDYIDAIKKIEYPEWIEGANKAHEIRKNRNLVHAKLGMSNSWKINRNTCNMVISYLNYIIKSRGIV
jgi:type I restriction-modification system DNA methylase subunit